MNGSFYKWLISKTKHSQALWCQHYLSFNMITDMVKTTNHSVSVEAYYTQYPRACVHLPCNVFIVGVSGGALVNIVPTKACVPHNECRITLQQPRSSIWKPRWRYRSSVSYSVLLVYGPKYWEIRRDTQIWDSYLIKTIAWKATIVSIYSVCVCVLGGGWGVAIAHRCLHKFVLPTLQLPRNFHQFSSAEMYICYTHSALPQWITLKYQPRDSYFEGLLFCSWMTVEQSRKAAACQASCGLRNSFYDVLSSNLLKHVKLSTKSRLCQKSKYISFCLVTKYLTRIMVQPPMDVFTFDHVLISENSK